ncbi:MAG: quinone oxidoreductase family protein [Trebonia sp.]
MKAVRIHETGSPDVMRVEDLDVPRPGTGQVLIRVAVAGINFTDIMARQGVYVVREAAPPMPTVLGTEVAGIVVGTGPGVPDAMTGKRVVSFVDGGYAEYAVAPAGMVTELPPEVDLGEAVSYLVQGVTAWQLLKDCGHLGDGQSVLVHSAAGGVGTLAVQLARVFGAGTVLATAGSAAKRQLAVELGADAAFDYTTPDWADEVLKATSGRGVDVILDAVGGEVGEQSLRCLAPFGRLVVYGVSGKSLAAFAGSQLMHKNQSVVGYWLTSRLGPRAADDEASARAGQVVESLLGLAGKGQLRGIVRHAFSLEDAATAHRAIADRRTVGKVILTV